MPQRLNLTALLVEQYDEAIAFFVRQLGFDLREDTAVADGKRWVVVAPRGASGGLLLARALGNRQRRAIGDQSGGRVFLLLEPTILRATTLPSRRERSASSRRPSMSYMASSPYSRTYTETDGIWFNRSRYAPDRRSITVGEPR